MPLLRTIVAGSIALPSGAPMPDGARIIFTLREWDKNSDTVAVAGATEASVTGGAISVRLIRTSTTDRNTLYDVGYAYFNPDTKRAESGYLGRISISGSESINLSDLLAVPAPLPDIPDALSQALAAAVDAIAAANSANNAALLALVGTGTGFDSVQQMLASTIVYGAQSITHNGQTVSLTVAAGNRWTTKEGFAYEVASSGAGDHHLVTDGGVKLYILGALATPSAFGAPTSTSDRIDQNVMLGGYGDFAQVVQPTRPAWDPILGPDPAASVNDLELLGHSIGEDNNSAIIIGGRPFYYSWVGDDASLSLSYGGDNINTHIAGMNVSMHSDLIQGLAADGVTPKGDHGSIFGGSYHRVAGSYSGSFAGQVKDVFALQSVALGGRNIKIGSLENVDAVRRSATLGGINLQMDAGFQNVLVGGEGNLLKSGNNSAIVGGENNEIDSVEQSFIASSERSKVTAPRASVLSSVDAVADVPCAVTRANGRDTASGDSQTHHIQIRRTMAGPNLFPSTSGGSGTELFQPPPNSRGVCRVLLTAQEKQTGTNKGAEYELRFAWSNIGGTLVILGQNLTTIFENDPAWNCVATTTGGNTRIAAQITTNGDTGMYLITGTGEIVMQKVAA